jgi:crossover junction endodeoxyribonuclease RuvC
VERVVLCLGFLLRVVGLVVGLVVGHQGSPRWTRRAATVVLVFVLGVDPGLSRCGYAVVRARARSKSEAVAMGVIRTPPTLEVPLRLAELQRELRLLLEEYRPVVVAVERIFLTSNARTAIGVAQASGLALAEAAARGIAVVQYSPTAVKSVVAGDGRADKIQVQTMVQMLLGLNRPPRPADAADAAALALCHLAHDPSLVLHRKLARS